MRVRVRFLAPVLALTLSSAGLLSQTTTTNAAPDQRTLLHQSAAWAQIQPHLPNPDTASAAALEVAADVLWARRFPDDALDYYGYAMTRGGDRAKIENKMGVVRLNMHQIDAARVLFRESIKASKDNAPAWNNLGVTEALSKNFSRATSDYKRAASLDSVTAVYRANAGMAYFEMKDMDKAREELSAAIQLDPDVLQKHGDTGVNAEMLGRDHYGELCFEMAKLFAGQKDVVEVRLWLTRANDNGYDVRGEMRRDAVLSPYLKDPEVQLMFLNHAQVHRQSVSATQGAAPGQQLNID